MGTLYVTIVEDDDDEPCEIFVVIGKAGSALVADAEAIGRLCSLALRSGADLLDIVDQLVNIGSDRSRNHGKVCVASLADGVALALEMWLSERIPVA